MHVDRSCLETLPVARKTEVKHLSNYYVSINKLREIDDEMMEDNGKKFKQDKNWRKEYDENHEMVVETTAFLKSRIREIKGGRFTVYDGKKKAYKHKVYAAQHQVKYTKVSAMVNLDFKDIMTSHSNRIPNTFLYRNLGHEHVDIWPEMTSGAGPSSRVRMAKPPEEKEPPEEEPPEDVDSCSSTDSSDSDSPGNGMNAVMAVASVAAAVPVVAPPSPARFVQDLRPLPPRNQAILDSDSEDHLPIPEDDQHDMASVGVGSRRSVASSNRVPADEDAASVDSRPIAIDATRALTWEKSGNLTQACILATRRRRTQVHNPHMVVDCSPFLSSDDESTPKKKKKRKKAVGKTTTNDARKK